MSKVISLPPIFQNYVIHPIESLPVPTFFVISSFLFFRKARYEECQMNLVLHFMKRLCILYLFWCVIWSPIIYLQKEYFHPFTIWVSLYIIRDFFFGNMFDASWFLGALLVGVSMVWGIKPIVQERRFGNTFAIAGIFVFTLCKRLTFWMGCPLWLV